MQKEAITIDADNLNDCYILFVADRTGQLFVGDAIISVSRILSYIYFVLHLTNLLCPQTPTSNV